MGRTVFVVLLLASACGRLGYDEVSPGETPDASVDAPDGIARVTVQRMGSGAGTIVGTDNFVCNDASCVLAVPIGTDVWLRGLPAAESWFAGWTSACGGNFECKFTATGDTTILAEFTPTPNRVFVTSTTTDGGFGGIAAADAICAARASAAGLSGVFVAFLSDGSTNAMTRIASSRGWVRLDGAPVADAPAAFANGDIIFPPRLDEYGMDVGSATLWTGTDGGSPAPVHCQGWTSAAGADDGTATRAQFASGVTGSWDHACTTQGRLLCVETGRTIQVHPKPDTGKLAFTTKTRWTPSGGRGQADALCASEAAAAGHGGTFLAAMATSTESIASRFTPGHTYRRVDGVRLLRDAGIFDVDFLDVPPELDPFGDLVHDDYWTGTHRWNQPTDPADNCMDWTTGDSMVDAEVHYTAYTEVRSSAKKDDCASQFPVLCLEQ